MSKNKLAYDLKWSFINRFSGGVLGLTFNVILLRLLTPADFGLVAMVGIFYGFLEVIRPLGLGESLIFRKKLRAGETSGLFVISLLSGFLIGALFYLATPWLVRFYQEPVLTEIVPFFALNFFIVSWAEIPISLQTRALRFKAIALINIFAQLGAGLLAISLALAGFGFFSLLWKTIFASILAAGGFLFLSRKQLALRRMNWRNIRPHLRFGGPLTLNSLLNYFARNLDDLLIGKYLGQSSLGVYNRAYALLLLPLNSISGVIGKVLFPVFSRFEEKEKVKNLFLKAIRLIAAVVFPIMLLLFLNAREITIGFLGSQWEDLYPLLKIFAVLGAFQSVARLNGAVYQGMGATALQMKVGLGIKSFIILMIVLGLIFTHSIVGVACFYTIASILSLWPEWLAVARLMDGKPREIINALYPPLLLCLGAGFLVEGLMASTPNLFDQWLLVVAFKSLLGLAFYLIGLRWQTPELWRGLKNVVLQMR